MQFAEVFVIAFAIFNVECKGNFLNVFLLLYLQCLSGIFEGKAKSFILPKKILSLPPWNFPKTLNSPHQSCSNINKKYFSSRNIDFHQFQNSRSIHIHRNRSIHPKTLRNRLHLAHREHANNLKIFMLLSPANSTHRSIKINTLQRMGNIIFQSHTRISNLNRFYYIFCYTLCNYFKTRKKIKKKIFVQFFFLPSYCF